MRPQGDPNSTIYFQKDEDTTTCRIQIIEDDIREANEAFVVTIEALNLGTLGSSVTTTVTIEDDDGIRATHYGVLSREKLKPQTLSRYTVIKLSHTIAILKAYVMFKVGLRGYKQDIFGVTPKSLMHRTNETLAFTSSPLMSLTSRSLRLVNHHYQGSEVLTKLAW